MNEPLSEDLVNEMISSFRTELPNFESTTLNESTQVQEGEEIDLDSLSTEDLETLAEELGLFEEEDSLENLSEEELEDIVGQLIEEGDLHVCPLCESVSSEGISEESFSNLLEAIDEAIEDEE